MGGVTADEDTDGRVRDCARAPLGPASPTACFALPDGRAGWGDAAVAAPWVIWRAYGDQRVLSDQDPSMRD